ncbi:hypothetical protein [Methanospirillum lacunae]
MNIEIIELFITTQEQMEVFYKEVSLLSSKKPNDEINIFKLNFINKVL